MSELYLRWRGWSVWWTTRWSWILPSAAAVAPNKPSWQRRTWSDEREGHNIIHTRERSSALFAPSSSLSPSASDNHAKCNLQHYLHLFTFTNYIPLKLPRKICQKNVITQSWNSASSEISSLPFWKKALLDSMELSASSDSWQPSHVPEVLPEACLGLGICRWTSQRHSGCLELQVTQNLGFRAMPGLLWRWGSLVVSGYGRLEHICWLWDLLCDCSLQLKVGCPV